VETAISENSNKFVTSGACNVEAASGIFWEKKKFVAPCTEVTL
jgi:hypothetical protein